MIFLITSVLWTLAMQNCDPNNPYNGYTIHGLWPPQEYCNSSPFNINDLTPIIPELNKAWISCPEYNWSNEQLWKHEWVKHGSCSNMTLLNYFNLTLTLWEAFSPICELFNKSPNCYLYIKEQNDTLTFKMFQNIQNL